MQRFAQNYLPRRSSCYFDNLPENSEGMVFWPIGKPYIFRCILEVYIGLHTCCLGCAWGSFEHNCRHHLQVEPVEGTGPAVKAWEKSCEQRALPSEYILIFWLSCTNRNRKNNVMMRVPGKLGPCICIGYKLSTIGEIGEYMSNIVEFIYWYWLYSGIRFIYILVLEIFCQQCLCGLHICCICLLVYLYNCICASTIQEYNF